MMALEKRSEPATDEAMLQLETKAAVLRLHESYCYQVAYYVLREERGARQAAQLALTRLFREGCFYKLSLQQQQQEVKSAAMRCALQVKKERIEEAQRS